MTQDARCVIEGPPPNEACNSSSSFPSGTGLDPTALIVTPSPNGGHADLSAVSDNMNTFLQANGGAFADIIVVPLTGRSESLEERYIWRQVDPGTVRSCAGQCCQINACDPVCVFIH
jgi:hypothetical protein